jgi:transposase InsO family protein
VGKVFAEFKESYGCHRVARVLNKRRRACSVGLVADVMCEIELKAVQPPAFRVVSKHSADDDYPDNLLDGYFTDHQSGTRLVRDITYLRTIRGWLHLATVIDLATRMMVGW